MRRLPIAGLLLLAAGACSSKGEGTTARAGDLVCVDCTRGAGGVYSVDFGGVIVSDVLERTLTLENRGSATLELGATGGLAAPFGCADCKPVSVPVGGRHTITLSFAPAVGGPATLEAHLPTDAEDLTLRLTGLGVTARFQCEPERLDFGGFLEDQEVTRTVVCTNPAEVQLGLVVEAIDDEGFTVKALEVEVNPGRALQIPVTFKPPHLGEAFGTLDLTTSGRLRVAAIPLSGSGLTHLLSVEPEEPCFDLGFVTPGTRRTRALTLRNRGGAPLSVTGLSLSGNPSFTAEPNGPFELEPALEDGDTAVVNVTFAPTELGRMDGVLSIASKDVSLPALGLDVCLKGFGGGPTLTCAPEAIAFGPTAIGSPRTRSFHCQNTGHDTPDTDDDRLAVETPVSSDPHFQASLQGGDSRFAAGEAFDLEITYAPDAPVSDAATIRLTSNDSALAELTLPVSGEGAACPPATSSCDRPPAWDSAASRRASRYSWAWRCRTPAPRPVSSATPVLLPTPAAPSGCRPEPAQGAVTVEAGDRYEVVVEFAPGVPGEHEGVLQLHVNGAPVQELLLSGSAGPSCLAVRPAPLDFGIVAPGCATQVRFLEVENTCDGEVTIDRVQIVASASVEFELGSIKLPLVLPAGVFRDVGLVYRPEAGRPGHDVGAVFLHLKGSPQPRVAGLTGTADGKPHQLEAFVQRDTPKVDVLFVVYGPVDPLRSEAVRDAFLSYPREQGIDFQIGITSTAVSGKGACVADGRLLPLEAAQRILIEGSQELDEWSLRAGVASCPVAPAEGLEAALRAISPPVVNNEDDPRHDNPDDGNLGFLRRSAHLSVVFVSSRDDQSPGSVDEYLLAYRATKGERRDNLFSAHAVIWEPGLSCDSGLEEGTRYADLVHRTFGETASFCSGDWPAGMDRVGRAAFGYEQCFELTNVPSGMGDPDAWFKLLIDGTDYPALGRRGERRWEYRAEQNAICFRPLSIPEPLAKVSVEYDVACLE